MPSQVLKLDSRDNVLIALRDLRKGESVGWLGETFVLASNVRAKHKFSTESLAPGGEVIMYGVLVGKAVQSIARGEVLTPRNVRHQTSPIKKKTQVRPWEAPDVSRWRERTFLGYPRSDGQVGTRNYWLVVPLVFCENRNIDVLRQAFQEELGFAPANAYRHQVAELVRLYREGRVSQIEKDEAEENLPHSVQPKIFENLHGIKFLLHSGGCGGTREDSNNLCGLIAGYIHHPNVAGATVLSLGCQHSQVAILEQELKRRDPNFSKPLLIFEQQRSRSESEMLTQAIRSTFLALAEANATKRQPAPLHALKVGLKCGGSDGFSGISANPAIGHLSDMLVSLGSTTILSEFPELAGVEQDFVDRSVDDRVAERFCRLMQEYDARAKAVGSGFEMNPSPGNIRDGLITDAMKSAGAAKKGGTAPVSAVLDYPEYATRPGLNLQCTPGNDVECVTAQVGAGANLVLFTTGLGTPTGNPIAPVLKIATNSELARRMADIIDVDAGPIVLGESTLEETAEAILERVIEVASGQLSTKAEQLGQDDFIPWKRGVSL